jgi:hypothetical protein
MPRPRLIATALLLASGAMGCDAPIAALHGLPAASDPPPPPTPDHLAALAGQMGFSVEQTEKGAVRFPHEGPGGGYVAELTVLDDVPSVRLRTDGLYHLEQAGSARGTGLLLTAIATLNHELAIGRVGLDPATGHIHYTVDVPADDAVSDLTLQQAIGRLLGTADALHPRLVAAAKGEAL